MKKIVVLILSILLLVSCAGLSTRTTQLLVEDYRTMNDSQLELYYHQLNDQLGREASAALRASGFDGKPREDQRVIALRARWNEVRAELRRRESAEK